MKYFFSYIPCLLLSSLLCLASSTTLRVPGLLRYLIHTLFRNTEVTKNNSHKSRNKQTKCNSKKRSKRSSKNMHHDVQQYKLAKLKATLVRLTGVKCKVTSLAKNPPRVSQGVPPCHLLQTPPLLVSSIKVNPRVSCKQR